MALLIRGGTVFAPRPLGVRDLFIAGGRIEAIAEPGTIETRGLDVQVIEAEGKSVLPGLIDPHVHILGGGGEGGPATRAPEIVVEDIAGSGVTTVIGCLGTDGITRHMTSLLAKARALESEGISTWLFAGSYELPVKTITGSVRSDLVLIDKIVGAGEIALSDHRSSQPTFDDIAKLAAECRVGGMLGGEGGYPAHPSRRRAAGLGVLMAPDEGHGNSAEPDRPHPRQPQPPASGRGDRVRPGRRICRPDRGHRSRGGQRLRYQRRDGRPAGLGTRRPTQPDHRQLGRQREHAAVRRLGRPARVNDRHRADPVPQIPLPCPAGGSWGWIGRRRFSPPIRPRSTSSRARAFSNPARTPI